MQSIGKTIRTLRHEHGATQGEMAEKLNISVPAYSKIETGITDINLSRLAQIAGLYELSVTGLLTYGDHADLDGDHGKLASLTERLRQREVELIILQNQLIGLFEELKLQPVTSARKRTG